MSAWELQAKSEAEVLQPRYVATPHHAANVSICQSTLSMPYRTSFGEFNDLVLTTGFYGSRAHFFPFADHEHANTEDKPTSAERRDVVYQIHADLCTKKCFRGTRSYHKPKSWKSTHFVCSLSRGIWVKSRSSRLNQLATTYTCGTASLNFSAYVWQFCAVSFIATRQ